MASIGTVSPAGTGGHRRASRRRPRLPGLRPSYRRPGGARSPPGARAVRAASPYLPPQDPGGFPARRRGAQPRHGGRAPGCRRGTAPAARRLAAWLAAAAGWGRGSGGRGPGGRTVKPAARASSGPGAASGALGERERRAHGGRRAPRGRTGELALDGSPSSELRGRGTAGGRTV